MKITALTNVGRLGNLQKDKIIEGSWNDIYKALDDCFINGCEIERQGNTDHWKVFAGRGSHVADIKIEGTKEEISKIQ